MTSITTLPQSSRTILRSTTIITSIPQIIHELVQNSLDAGASQVDIGVNLDLWQCWVRDNGHGIDKMGMNVLAQGGEEGRYGSSKTQDHSSSTSMFTLGFRGEALASTADVSILEIASKTALSLDTWSIIMKGGKPLYYGPATRWKRERAGTTVVIRDAFYNLPVRRRTHPNISRTFELIRKDLECTAMVFPQVALSLENSAKEQRTGSRRGKILNIPKTNSSLATFRHLFGRTLCQNFEEINVQEGDICIQGFLGVEGVHTKLHQYLYLNKQLLSPCEYHRVIDARLASSSFGRHALEANADGPSRPVIRRSPRKNERRPIYLLSIVLPTRLVDNFLEPAKASVNVKDSDVLCGLLDRIIYSFLLRNGFASRSHKRTLDDLENTSSKRYRKERAEPSVMTPLNSKPEPSTQNSNKISLADSFCDRPEKTQWIDAIAGRMYSVDSKTGNPYGISEQGRKLINDDYSDPGVGHINVNTRWLKKSKDDFTVEQTPGWFQDTLTTWRNPTFGFAENNARSLSVSALQDGLARPGSGMHYKLPSVDKDFVATISGNFNKAELEKAEIIGQVDTKFIACVIKSTSTQGVRETLVLVDQHAADERVRVEQLLSSVCAGYVKHGSDVGIEASQLDPPVPVLLNKFELKVLRDNDHFLEAFARWGFGLELATESKTGEDEESDSTEEYCQVFIREIPEILSQKLLAGNELRDFVKGYLARLSFEGIDLNLSKANDDHHWTAALRSCPRELIDMINSKACRGAIMFNDRLSLDQCRWLIYQLSRTVWPFMCAHGRPSLIPLAEVELDRNLTKKSIDWSNLGISLCA